MNDPNLTTRNAPPAMTISIKQVNGNLIPVTMQEDLAIHLDLSPLQDISVVPNCEMNLLSVAHMCETWDTSVVLDSDQIHVMKKKINLSDSQIDFAWSTEQWLVLFGFTQSNQPSTILYC